MTRPHSGVRLKVVLSPVSRYDSPRDYLWTGVVALAFTAFSAWVGVAWHWAWIAAGLLLLGAVVAFTLGLLPDIEVYESHLRVEGRFRGRARRIPWPEVARVDKRSEERRVGKKCRSRWSPYH